MKITLLDAPVACARHAAGGAADLAERITWAEAYPERAAQIAEAGQKVAATINVYELACFWWQLLSAMAPLQTHQARGVANGFLPFAG